MTFCARLAAASSIFFLVGCAIEERADFLIGRICDPDRLNCDPDQKCLPHALRGEIPTDFRCRDAASFVPTAAVPEPPLAYCGVDQLSDCPDGLICNADRVREDDAGVRRRICQSPTNPFGPPAP